MGNKGSLKPQLQKWRRQDGSNLKKPLAAEKRVDLTLMWSVVEVAPMTQQITDPLSTLIASNDFLNHLLKDKSLKTASNLMLKLFYSWARQFDILLFPMRRTWSLVGKCTYVCLHSDASKCAKNYSASLLSNWRIFWNWIFFCDEFEVLMKNTFVWVNQLKSKQRGGGVVANMA